MAFSSLVKYIKGYCARPEVSNKGISLFCLSIPGLLTLTTKAIITMFIKIAHYLLSAVYVVFLIWEPGSGICAKLHVAELGSKAGERRLTDDSTQRD
jgi:hypothetical protein